MQHNRGIGENWAKSILAQGYITDNRNPMVTKARIFDKESQEFKEVELNLGIIKSRYKTRDWRGRKLVKEES